MKSMKKKTWRLILLLALVLCSLGMVDFWIGRYSNFTMLELLAFWWIKLVSIGDFTGAFGIVKLLRDPFWPNIWPMQMEKMSRYYLGNPAFLAVLIVSRSLVAFLLVRVSATLRVGFAGILVRCFLLAALIVLFFPFHLIAGVPIHY